MSVGEYYMCSANYKITTAEQNMKSCQPDLGTRQTEPKQSGQKWPLSTVCPLLLGPETYGRRRHVVNRSCNTIGWLECSWWQHACNVFPAMTNHRPPSTLKLHWRFGDTSLSENENVYIFLSCLLFVQNKLTLRNEILF